MHLTRQKLSRFRQLKVSSNAQFLLNNRPSISPESVGKGMKRYVLEHP